MAETYVRARVDTQLKHDATALLNMLGLSMSDFIRIALTKVVLERGVPFEMKVPNELTRSVIDEVVARRSQPNYHAPSFGIEDLDNELKG